MAQIDLNGRRVLVVGLAQTGLATARFLKQKGSIVSATEIRPIGEMTQAAQAMEELAIPVEWGGHRKETFLRQDLIVMSPGVDLAIEPIQRALKKGVRMISEIELASHFIHSPMI